MKWKNVMKVAAFLTAVIMMASMAACGGNTGSETGTSSAGETTAPSTETTAAKVKDPVELTILINQTANDWSTYLDNPVAKEIQNQTGISFSFEESDENKFKVLLAGGDLPDIVRADAGIYGKQLIEGNLVISLEELLKTNGQDVAENIPTALDISRKNWSNNTGKLYFLPPQVQAEPAQHYFDITGQPGLCIRWDYYKEIGCPEINNEDDLLNALAAIQAKHPKTEDGKSIYGLSSFNDAGLFPYQFSPFPFAGYATKSAGKIMTAKIDSMQLDNILTTEGSNYWTQVSTYYKAQKMGLLDPDALTMKFEDYSAKATAGQIICGPVAWAMGNFNAENAKDGKGFINIPAGKYGWFGEITPSGWAGKQYSISKSCQTPDRAMDLLNYFFSYDGARTMWSGVKGKDWDIVDGKPKLKEETLQLQSSGGENWKASGIQLDKNLIGLGANVVNPADGLPMSLFETPELYSKLLNPVQKDYCAHYGVQYPGEVFEKLVKEGKMANFYTESRDISVVTKNILTRSALVEAPDDIKTIEAKLLDMAAKSAGKCILSKSDAEFEANKVKAIAEFKTAGADTLTQWYTKAWDDAMVAVGAK